jgi:uncharacterized protein YndB with AHSA1/START domain
MDDGFTRTFSVEAAVDDVWRALTEPEEMQAWFAPRVISFDHRPGGKIVFGDDEHEEVECEIVEIEPPRRLRWIEDPSVLPGTMDVTVTIEAADYGARVSIAEAKHAEGPTWPWDDEMIVVEKAVADLRKHLASKNGGRA